MNSTLSSRPNTVYHASQGDKFNMETTLVAVNCPTCGILYAIPEELKASALRWRGDRADGRGWQLCCPLGHTWWYTGESALDREKRLLRHERDRAGRLAAELDQTKAHLRGQTAAKTRALNEKRRLQQRVAAGVCPCCNRSFTNLRRHIETKHPTYKEAGTP